MTSNSAYFIYSGLAFSKGKVSIKKERFLSAYRANKESGVMSESAFIKMMVRISRIEV